MSKVEVLKARLVLAKAGQEKKHARNASKKDKKDKENQGAGGQKKGGKAKSTRSAPTVQCVAPTYTVFSLLTACQMV
jgi:hypothetical protein